MTANQDIWKLVYDKLSEKYTETIRTLWFSSINLVAMNDEYVVLATDSNMKADIINKKYSATLEEIFEQTVGFPLRVSVLSAEEKPIDEEQIRLLLARGEKIEPYTLQQTEQQTEPLFVKIEAEEKKKKEEPQRKEMPVQNVYSNASSREYTFDNFIVGNSNAFAHAACLAVAKNPESPYNDSQQSYNPLFIYGPSGLGKTHLLYAITNEIRDNNPNATIIYVKGEAFTNQIIAAISNQTTAEFRNKYRRADVLLIDDIQFIAGKNSTQEEFFHTFNALYEDHKQIILTSDRPPKDIKTLEERLKTRFEWGLIVDIQPPDLELRIAILRSKAQSMNLQIPQDVQTYLAEKLKNNIRQLEGALKKMSAYTSLTGNPINLNAAKSCVADVISGTEPTSVTVDRILELVAKKYNVSVDDLSGSKRSKEIVVPRHIAIYMIRNVTQLSLPAIGKLLNRDHSTVLSSIETIEKRMAAEPVLDQEIRDMIAEIKKEG